MRPMEAKGYGQAETRKGAESGNSGVSVGRIYPSADLNAPESTTRPPLGESLSFWWGCPNPIGVSSR